MFYKSFAYTLLRLGIGSLMFVPLTHAAEGGATKAEAEAMVRKAVAYIKANGGEASLRGNQ